MFKITQLIGMLGIFLLSFAFNANSQKPKSSDKNSYEKTLTKVSNGTETIYNDLKAQSPKIGAALESLGKELKTGVNAVWDILVKQQLVWSIAFLILTLSAIINWFVFYKRYLGKPLQSEFITLERSRFAEENISNPDYNKYSSDMYKQRETILKTIAVGTEQYLEPLPCNNSIPKFKYLHLIICLLLSGFSFYHFNDMLTGFINPEYGAMKTIYQVAATLK